MKKIVAILVAVGLLAGVVFFIGRSGAGTAELSLTFVGFETNGAARFVVSNHSSRAIDYFGPTEELSRRGPCVPSNVKPGASCEELLWRPAQKTQWQAVVVYGPPARFADKLRDWLWQAHIPFVQPADLQVTVWSAPVPPR